MRSACEVAFIDPGVSNIDVLLAGLRPDVEPRLLSAKRPALAQMAEALAGRTRLAAVHVIAHGRPGQVSFAGEPLTMTSLAAHGDHLAAIGRATDELLLWSCETARDETGRAFVAALAEATGARVAAATQRVGAADKGGSWTLNAGAGSAKAPLTATGINCYPAALARYVFETMTDAQALSFKPGRDSLTFSDPNASNTTVNVQYVANPDGSTTVVITDTNEGLSHTFGPQAFPFAATFQSGHLFAGGAGADIFYNATGAATNDAFFGGPGDDSLTAGNGTSVFMQGNTGNDSLVGGTGSDTLFGGADNDTIRVAQNEVGHAFVNGNMGDDTIFGGAGGDTLFGGQGDDLITGGTGANLVNGNLGADTIIGHSRIGDWLSGGQGDDLINASASTGNNILNGNLGNDTIIGGAGADTLRGGQGDDVIHAGSGADWISGDLGNNTIYGGPGADTFHAGAGHDVVTGWHAGDHVQVDAGTTWTVTQVNADVHIVFANGGEMDLMNTQLSSLQSGWIAGA